MPRRNPEPDRFLADGEDVTLYRRPNSAVWWYDFTIGTVRTRRSTGRRDRGEAAAEGLRAFEEAKADAGVLGRRQGVTLAKLARLDLERAQSEGTGQRQQDSIEARWAFVIAGFLNAAPAEITYDGVVKYIADRRAAGARGKTIREEVQGLKRMIDGAAVRNGWRRAPLGQWPKVRTKGEEPRAWQKGKLHEPDVIRRWLAAMREEPQARDAADQAEVVILTAMRAEEAQKVCWSWVERAPEGSDPDVAAILRIPMGAAKNRRERPVGVPHAALAILARAAGGRGPDEPLWPGDHKRARRAAQERIGYPRRITLRDLRHSHATWAGEKGDLPGLQGAMGHTDARTTSRYLTATTKRAALCSAIAARAMEGRDGPAVPGASGHSGPAHPEAASAKAGEDWVEANGIEPMTFWLQTSAPPEIAHILTCSRCLAAVERLASLCVGAGSSRHTARHTDTPAREVA